jgi:hypothetical protein
MELVLRIPDRDHAPAVLDRARDMGVASIGQRRPTLQNLRVDLVLEVLISTLDLVHDYNRHLGLLSRVESPPSASGRCSSRPQSSSSL